jgi:hypothetical protein
VGVYTQELDPKQEGAIAASRTPLWLASGWGCRSVTATPVYGELLFRQATGNATLLHPLLYVVDFKRALGFGEAQFNTTVGDWPIAGRYFRRANNWITVPQHSSSPKSVSKKTRFVFVVPDYHADCPKPCVGGWDRKLMLITPDWMALLPRSQRHSRLGLRKCDGKKPA